MSSLPTMNPVRVHSDSEIPFDLLEDTSRSLAIYADLAYTAYGFPLFYDLYGQLSSSYPLQSATEFGDQSQSTMTEALYELEDQIEQIQTSQDSRLATLEDDEELNIETFDNGHVDIAEQFALPVDDHIQFQGPDMLFYPGLGSVLPNLTPRNSPPSTPSSSATLFDLPEVDIKGNIDAAVGLEAGEVVYNFDDTEVRVCHDPR